MPNIHDDPAALKALQDQIYREHILRARAITEQQRLDEVFNLSKHQFGMMLAGAMHRLGTTDEAAGWEEVRRWMRRLGRVHDHDGSASLDAAAYFAGHGFTGAKFLRGGIDAWAQEVDATVPRFRLE